MKAHSVKQLNEAKQAYWSGRCTKYRSYLTHYINTGDIRRVQYQKYLDNALIKINEHG